MSFSPSPSKRGHKDRTLETKIKALNMFESGKKVKDICIQLKVAQSTVSTWIKKKDEIRAMASEGINMGRMRQRETSVPEVHKALHLWLKNLRAQECNAPISHEILRMKAVK